jgi:hypothetical protein
MGPSNSNKRWYSFAKNPVASISPHNLTPNRFHFSLCLPAAIWRRWCWEVDDTGDLAADAAAGKEESKMEPASKGPKLRWPGDAPPRYGEFSEPSSSSKEHQKVMIFLQHRSI